MCDSNRLKYSPTSHSRHKIYKYWYFLIMPWDSKTWIARITTKREDSLRWIIVIHLLTKENIKKASSQYFALILLRIYQTFPFSPSPRSFMNAVLWQCGLYIPFHPDGILHSGLWVKTSVQVPLHLLILQMNRCLVGRSQTPLKNPLQSRGCFGGMGDLNIAHLNGQAVMHISPNPTNNLFVNYFTRLRILAH